MKAMPLSFENFQGEGVSDLDSSLFSLLNTKFNQQQPDQNPINWDLFSYNHHKKQEQEEEFCYVGGGGGGGSNHNIKNNIDTYSVFESRKNSPSSLTSSTSTLSSSHSGGGGGGGGGASTGVAASNNEGGTEKCGMGMEDWESVLSGSPSQEQSILRLIMGDVEDPSVGLNKILQTGNGSHDLEFNGGFGIVDQAFGFESSNNNNPNNNNNNILLNNNNNIDYPVVNHDLQTHNARVSSISNPNPLFSSSANNLFPVSLFQHHSIDGGGGGVGGVVGGGGGGLDEKPQIYNPQMVMNQNQAHFNQNPAMFLPLSYEQLQKHYPMSAATPPPPKRLNSGSLIGPNFLQVPKVPFLDSGQEMFLRRHQQQLHQQQRPTPAPPPPTAATAATKPRMPGEEMTSQQLQQAVIDQLFKTAELIETGNQILAQEILARLNQQLSPIGKPFQRAAFYIKEAFQLLLHMNTSNNNQNNHSSSPLPPYSLIFKIGAYKSFSEISPILQFANFTCNQALLEVFDGFDRIHIIDFDIGYGGQWASLMQELVMRNNGPPSLKITAFVSPSTHDELELGFTRESLQNFANEINISFEIEIISLEAMNSNSWPIPLQLSDNEAIAVNLPIGSFSNYPSFLPVVLRFVKQISPKIVVSLDKGCDRTDAPFPHHMIHALQSYSGLLESLDAVNMNLDALQKIERFLIQPGIEKIVLGRHRSIERMPPWRSLFMQSGFTPLTFSNFTESQAECLVQKTPIRGFHVEKRQSSLGLYWQRKELISASAWRC